MTFLHKRSLPWLILLYMWCATAGALQNSSSEPETEFLPAADALSEASNADNDAVSELADTIPADRDMGKREVDGSLRPKFGQNYKWIGLGKRDSEGGTRSKFGQNYKWIGLGKRDPRIKVSPTYKYIGLGKRMAPYWSSQLLTNFKDVFVTKKVTPAAGVAAGGESSGTIFSEEDMPVMHPQILSGQGRPNTRGGAFEPIYVGRYVGLGRR
ncbi:uncharacterized protein LOC129591312 isoform X2 [Paramacrobiotus metropolitanus]|uniref:uncharacterized protein LOC129591312 isoform X2 n=1 Tax=Paramacrobiotus metropolitanus TaxID=2943436 RepID=UPI0024463E1F|nr:uncharacterized protein LOC129591312 isoform X2 [Paramacrobiotus metropolitanus]